MGSVLAVGRSSFLAQSVAASGAAGWRFIGHNQLEQGDPLADVDCVVNFAWNPATTPASGDVEQCLDLRLSRRIGERPISYVMLSSRRVYGQDAGFGVREDAPCRPSEPYGAAKAAIETELRRRLGDRLTVLRVANVTGYERTPGRATFMAQALRGLKDEGTIRFDMNPSVRRDFLPAGAFVKLVTRVAAAPLAGVFNVGSGTATPAGRIAEWLMAGFGRGRLVVENDRQFDEFSLDIGRAAAAFGLDPRPAEFEDYYTGIGRRLAEEG